MSLQGTTWTRTSTWKLLLFLQPKESAQKNFVRTSKISKRRKDEQIKHAPHLVFKAPERTPKLHALSFFDDHYGKVFGRRWPSVRLALFSPPKYCALVNNFATVEETVRHLREEEGCASVKSLVGEAMNGVYEEGGNVDVTVPSRERSRRQRKSEEDELVAAVGGKEEVSMPLDESVIRGRLILPSEQVMSGQNDADALHDFVPTSEIKGMEDFVEEEQYFEKDDSGGGGGGGSRAGGVPIARVVDRTIRYPDQLDAFVYPSSNISRFPQPRKTVLDTFDYYCLDLASLLPVIALNVSPHDRVLDMCSGPGGKSLAVLQTLMPAALTCNDHSHSRLKRVMDVFDMYMKDIGGMKKLVTFKKWDGLELPFLYSGEFDKVLCDVPCYTDRQVLNVDENNIFAPVRKKERILLPRLQMNLLVAAIKCTKPGGSVVYSTCSLSPMQNDGVVYGALKTLWQETDIDFYVNDLSPSFEPFKSILNLVNKECGLKYGQLVLPHIANNFGPMYFAKITRTK